MQNWRNKPSSAAKAAANRFYSDDLADDLEPFTDVPATKRRATAEEIREYQAEQDRLRDLEPCGSGDGRLGLWTEPAAPVAAAPVAPDDDMPNSHTRARFEDLGAVSRFLHGGRAVVTVVSKRTKKRFTFRFTRPKPDPQRGNDAPPTFVSVLTGPDNETAYSYMGTMFPGRADPLAIVHTAKSRIGSDAPSASAAQWFVRAVAAGGPVLEQCEVWHEGRCGRCGRVLTVPESIASGFGPECINYV